MFGFRSKGTVAPESCMKSTHSLLPEPRSYSGTAIMVGSIMALPFAIVWSWLFAATQGLSFGQVLPLGLGGGVLFGLFFGLSMAFFFKRETADIDYSDKKGFVARLNVATSQLGYNPASQTEDFLSYKP